MNAAILTDDGSVRSWIEHAHHTQAPLLRQDSRRGTSPLLDGTRGLIRQWAADAVDATARQGGVRLDEKRRAALVVEAADACASGLGLRVDGQTVRCDSAWYAPDSLTFKDGDPLRPQYAERTLSETVPVRTVPQWAADYLPGAVAYSGSVAPYRPGMTEIPLIGVAAGYRRRPVHTFVAKTQIDWLALIQAQRADFSVVAEQAQAASIVFAEFQERALAAGIPGLDWTGAYQLGVGRYASSVDYSGSPAINDVYSDLTRLIQTAVDVAGDRGRAPDTMLIGTRWLRAIARTNNLAAGGGGMTGSQMIADKLLAQTELERVMGSNGIRRIIPCRALNSWGGDSTLDGAVLLAASDSQALRQIVSMAPAPVRSFSGLTADEQLWACRHGGLDVQDALPVSVGFATVSA
jgi:hypothetical protein